MTCQLRIIIFQIGDYSIGGRGGRRRIIFTAG